MTNPEHQRTNPQRAIDEYKNNTPPPVKLGQGRDELDTPHLVRVCVVLACTFVGLSAFLFLCYVVGGWQ